MGKEIENIRLKFQCDVDWDSMEFVNGIKHCNYCHKNVYDFTDAKRDEFLVILAENDNNICGRFKKEQTINTRSISPIWKKLTSAAILLLGVSIFNNKSQAQSAPNKTIKQNIDKDIVLGFAMPDLPYDKIAEFPGGEKAFRSFLSSHMKFIKGMKLGRVFVTFNIEKNGQLDNYKIIRGLDELNNNEVIRVLKLSPKWTPATLKGKPVAISYTMPVNFSM
jgi:hypothetical protein